MCRQTVLTFTRLDCLCTRTACLYLACHSAFGSARGWFADYGGLVELINVYYTVALVGYAFALPRAVAPVTRRRVVAAFAGCFTAHVGWIPSSLRYRRRFCALFQFAPFTQTLVTVLPRLRTVALHVTCYAVAV